MSYTSYGDITIEVGGELFSTKDASNNQSKMLLPTLVELMDGMVKYFQKNQKHFEFIGTGSSYAIHFSRVEKNATEMDIFHAKKVTLPNTELIRSLHKGIDAFMEENLRRISSSDPAYYDLKDAWSEFEELAKDECS